MENDLSIIKEIFPKEEIKYDYMFPKSKHKVDLFLPHLGIVIESDWNEQKDKEISDELFNMLKAADDIETRNANFNYSEWFRIIHMEKGHLGKVIRELMKDIEDTTWDSPVSYM